MKYEAPICEILRINNIDIIRTSGPDDTETGDTPMMPIDDLNIG
jgi:hypothetical protein